MVASVSSSTLATDTAFSRPMRTTLVGSDDASLNQVDVFLARGPCRHFPMLFQASFTHLEGVRHWARRGLIEVRLERHATQGLHPY
jgi:hypothetical protein